MSLGAPRIIAVRHGRVQPSGSWLYVWIDIADGEIAYVGSTGFDPELRSHLHVTSAHPELGRVRASVPGYEERDFDVLGFELPDGIERASIKRMLAARLCAHDDPGDGSEESDAMREIVDHLIRVIDSHRRCLAHSRTD